MAEAFVHSNLQRPSTECLAHGHTSVYTAVRIVK